MLVWSASGAGAPGATAFWLPSVARGQAEIDTSECASDFLEQVAAIRVMRDGGDPSDAEVGSGFELRFDLALVINDFLTHFDEVRVRRDLPRSLRALDTTRVRKLRDSGEVVPAVCDIVRFMHGYYARPRSAPQRTATATARPPRAKPTPTPPPARPAPTRTAQVSAGRPPAPEATPAEQAPARRVERASPPPAVPVPPPPAPERKRAEPAPVPDRAQDVRKALDRGSSQPRIFPIEPDPVPREEEASPARRESPPTPKQAVERVRQAPPPKPPQAAQRTQQASPPSPPSAPKKAAPAPVPPAEVTEAEPVESEPSPVVVDLAGRIERLLRVPVYLTLGDLRRQNIRLTDAQLGEQRRNALEARDRLLDVLEELSLEPRLRTELHTALGPDGVDRIETGLRATFGDRRARLQLDRALRLWLGPGP